MRIFRIPILSLLVLLCAPWVAQAFTASTGIIASGSARITQRRGNETQLQDGSVLAIENSSDYAARTGAADIQHIRTSGNVDESFGTDGKIHFDQVAATVAAVAADGSFYLWIAPANPTLQEDATPSFVIERRTTRGRADTTFGSHGRVTVTVPPAASDGLWGRTCTNKAYRYEAGPALVDAKGRLVVVVDAVYERVGKYTSSNLDAYVAVRLNPDGTRDTTFASANSNVLALGAKDCRPGFLSLEREADGGFASNASEQGLQRITDAGEFSWSTVPRVPGDRFEQVRVSPDGGVIAFSHDKIIRIAADGAIDPSFHSIAATYHARIAMQPDGRIIVWQGAASIARYLPDGTPDLSFGFGGTSVVCPPIGHDLYVGSSQMVVTDDGLRFAATLHRAQANDGQLLFFRVGSDVPGVPAMPTTNLYMQSYMGRVEGAKLVVGLYNSAHLITFTEGCGGAGGESTVSITWRGEDVLEHDPSFYASIIVKPLTEGRGPLTIVTRDRLGNEGTQTWATISDHHMPKVIARKSMHGFARVEVVDKLSGPAQRWIRVKLPRHGRVTKKFNVYDRAGNSIHCVVRITPRGARVMSQGNN